MDRKDIKGACLLVLFDERPSIDTVNQHCTPFSSKYTYLKMHFSFFTVLALFSASALAEPIPKAAADAILDKRGDNWCRVVENVNCRKGPGTNFDKVTVEGRSQISPSKNFGVRCTHEGTSVGGDKTWDYIPGWNCWVSAYYTRTAGSQTYCETIDMAQSTDALPEWLPHRGRPQPHPEQAEQLEANPQHTIPQAPEQQQQQDDRTPFSLQALFERRAMSLHEDKTQRRYLITHPRNYPGRQDGSTWSIDSENWRSYTDLYCSAKHKSRKLAALAEFEARQPVDFSIWTIEKHDKYLQQVSELLESPLCIVDESSLQLFENGRDNHGLKLITLESLRRLKSCHPGPAKLLSAQVEALKGPPCSSTGWASTTFAGLVDINLQAIWLNVDQILVHPALVKIPPTVFIDLVNLNGVSHSFAPGFLLSKLIATVGPDNNSHIYDSSRDPNDPLLRHLLRLDFLAAGPIDIDTHAFGMTETCGSAVFNLSSNRDVAQGLFDLWSENDVRKQKSRPRGAAPGVLHGGQLQVRGDVIFDGYYHDSTATAKAFTADGWFRTGVQATLDERGNLCLASPLKDDCQYMGQSCHWEQQ
ncbi:hypothetical protein B0H66DRAFT_637923 [Apodospora peruviana]|uniref:AMP-dependent synthetase/ligase domain-containing protein n=1 Tax=Apodospora peruviana TaxID=516989 RepID=A0AAE0MD60_9PEZI|nr:hypothetical protein B0H66DRAFT_637923 [Apodospora peruviana]